MKFTLIPLVLLISFQCFSFNTGYIPSTAFSDTLNCIDGLAVKLDSNAQYVLQPDQIFKGSSENFKVDTIYLDSYTLDCDNLGSSTITLSAMDDKGTLATCIANISVYGNIPPNVLDDSVVTEVNTPVEINIVANDYDEETKLNISTISIFSEPDNGILSIDPVSGNLKYIPNLGFVGIEQFSYSICDDGIPCVPMCGMAEVYIKVANTTGIEAQQAKGDIPFIVYPNPAKEFLNIDFATRSIRKIELFNSVGQLIYTTQTDALNTVIDLHSLNYKGLVVIQVKGDKSIANQKVMLR